MLVHITLTLTEEEAQSRGEAAVAALRGAGVDNIDVRYLKRYSLVAGQVDPAAMEAVKALSFVKAVEADGTVTAF